MHKALDEVLRFVSSNAEANESEALRQYKESITLPCVDRERWLPMPRKYTRNCTRFTLPIRTSDLATLTPIQYVSRHIWVSDNRKQLYQYVFNKFVVDPYAVRPDRTSDKLTVSHRATPLIINSFDLVSKRERTMVIKHLNQAMTLALGFYGTAENVDKVRAILQMNNGEVTELNFRSWCGVIAFAERFLNELPVADDSIDEVSLTKFVAFRSVDDNGM